jgi:hypothetical protein
MQDYYACPVCQEELEYDPCDEPCCKCIWWIMEERKESERYERLMQEREAWISEHKI